MICLNEKFLTVLSDGYGGDIRVRFQAIPPEEWLTKYNRVSPWVDDVLRDAGLRPKDVPAPKWSPYLLLVSILAGTLESGGNSFYHTESLVQEAIKHNFPEGNPDRILLMKSTDIGPRKPPTEKLRWCQHGYDYSKTFDSELLVKLKPGLLAYLNDLKNLAKGNDRS